MGLGQAMEEKLQSLETTDRVRCYLLSFYTNNNVYLYPMINKYIFYKKKFKNMPPLADVIEARRQAMEEELQALATAEPEEDGHQQAAEEQVSR